MAVLLHPKSSHPGQRSVFTYFFPHSLLCWRSHLPSARKGMFKIQPAQCSLETIYPRSLILSTKDSRQGNCRGKWAVSAQSTGWLSLPTSLSIHPQQSTHAPHFLSLKALLTVLCCQYWDTAASPNRGLLPDISRDPCSFPNDLILLLEARSSVWGTGWTLYFLVTLKNGKPLLHITPLPTLTLCPLASPSCSSTSLHTSSLGDDPWKPPAVCHRSDNYIPPPPLASCLLLLTSHLSSLLITPWHQSLWQGSSTTHVTCQPGDMTYRAMAGGQREGR